jgi:hypothetical protein
VALCRLFDTLSVKVSLNDVMLALARTLAPTFTSTTDAAQPSFVIPSEAAESRDLREAMRAERVFDASGPTCFPTPSAILHTFDCLIRWFRDLMRNALTRFFRESEWRSKRESLRVGPSTRQPRSG